MSANSSEFFNTPKIRARPGECSSYFSWFLTNVGDVVSQYNYNSQKGLNSHHLELASCAAVVILVIHKCFEEVEIWNRFTYARKSHRE